MSNVGATARSRGKENVRRGRYDDGRDVRQAPVGRGLPSYNTRTAFGAVQDPENRARRISVAIATTVDVLEADLSRDLITEAAYAMGRMLQGIWEHADGQRIGSAWRAEAGGGAISPEAIDRRMLRLLADAETIKRFEADAAEVVGTAGVRFLRRALIGGRPYSAVAADEGKSGDRGTAYAADRCRWLLEQLAQKFGT
jgi:hypothetical protein